MGNSTGGCCVSRSGSISLVDGCDGTGMLSSSGKPHGIVGERERGGTSSAAIAAESAAIVDELPARYNSDLKRTSCGRGFGKATHRRGQVAGKEGRTPSGDCVHHRCPQSACFEPQHQHRPPRWWKHTPTRLQVPSR